jgi:tetratricopeptide (TPR) repeat protein
MQVPIEVRNLILLIGLILQVHWLLWYYFDIEFGSEKAFWEVVAGGGVAAIYATSSGGTQEWIKERCQIVLGSLQLSKLLVLSIVAALAIGCLVSRATIALPNGHDTILVDGKKLQVDTSSSKNTATTYGLSFSTLVLELNAFRTELVLVPFVPKTLRISETDLFADSGAYRELNSLLLLSFFQYLENLFLSKANNIFDSPDGKHFVELNKIYQILKLCFVDQDVARHSEIQLEEYIAEYKHSSWTPLLKACIAYSRRQYDEAASYLESTPKDISVYMAATYHFFRGVNLLKTFSERTIAGQVSTLSDGALAEFRKTNSILAGQSGYFTDIARPSAQIFSGITNVYAKNLDDASRLFSVAATATHPGLRSRAYNDLGFVEMIRGRLGDAEKYFLEALQKDGTYPLARINLGYIYMAQGKYPAAGEILLQASKDEILKSTSFRDVLLAEAALAHLEIIQAKQPANPAVYDGVLKQMNLFNYAGTTPTSLRLAYIHRSLAEQLYTGEKYYGLEIFAAEMYAWSYLEAAEAVADGAGSSATESMKLSLQKFTQLKDVIHAGWITTRNDSGFFAAVYTVLEITNKSN